MKNAIRWTGSNTADVDRFRGLPVMTRWRASGRIRVGDWLMKDRTTGVYSIRRAPDSAVSAVIDRVVNWLTDALDAALLRRGKR